MSPNFSLLLAFSFSSLFLLSTVIAVDITKLLNQYSDFSNFNKYLNQTQVANEINNRQTITVLAVANGNLSPLSGQSTDIIKKVMSLHVILDYYDVSKLQNSQNKTLIVTTLFQSSGQATGQQGFLNITRTSGGVALGSAVPGSSLNANLLKSVVSQPYNLSVLQISTVIIPTGIGSGNSNSSTNSTASSPQSSPTPASAPTKSPSPASSPVTSPAGKAPASAPSNTSPPADKAPAPSNAAPPGANIAPAPTATAPSTNATPPANADSPVESPSTGSATTPTADTPVADTPASSPPAMVSPTAATPVADGPADAADGPAGDKSGASIKAGIINVAFMIILCSAYWAAA